MKSARVVAAVLLVAIAFVLALPVVFSSTSDDLIDRTIARNYRIDSHLRLSAKFARETIDTLDRIPNADDIERWKRKDPNSERGATWFQGAPFATDILQRFGPPPDGPDLHFVVTYWRGEWREYYISWTDTTSLEFKKDNYYVLGSKGSQNAVYSTLSVIALGLSWLAWPKRSRNDA